MSRGLQTTQARRRRSPLLALRLNEKEEPIRYAVELTRVGERKINTIKIIVDELQISIQAAKAYADMAPVVVSCLLGRGRADALVRKLREAGNDARVIIEYPGEQLLGIPRPRL